MTGIQDTRERFFSAFCLLFGQLLQGQAGFFIHQVGQEGNHRIFEQVKGQDGEQQEVGQGMDQRVGGAGHF